MKVHMCSLEYMRKVSIHLFYTLHSGRRENKILVYIVSKMRKLIHADYS